MIAGVVDTGEHLREFSKQFKTARWESYVLSPLFVAVPEGGCPHPVVDEGEEGLLDQQLGVEDDQLGRGGDEVVALVELEKLDEDLRLVIFLKKEKENYV